MGRRLLRGPFWGVDLGVMQGGLRMGGLGVQVDFYGESMEGEPIVWVWVWVCASMRRSWDGDVW